VPGAGSPRGQMGSARVATFFRGGRLGWPRPHLPAGFVEACLIVLALRLVLALAPLIMPTRPGSGPAWRLVDVWMHLDAHWYANIATNGYGPRDLAVAFFPLYPLLMRLVLPLTGGVAVAGFLISTLAAVAALTGLYQLVASDFTPAVARRATLACALFPTAFFLLIPYTESLFLALAVWSLHLARRGRWGWVAVLGLLAGLSRTQGCLLALPLAWEVVRQRRVAPRAAFLAPFLPVAGFAAFLGYSQLATGWTTFEAQDHWVAGYRTPWDLVANAIRFTVRSGYLGEALHLAALFLSCALLLAGFRRLPLSYTLYAATHLLTIATRENHWMPMVSTTRYVLVIFPIFVVLALARGWLFGAWLALSAVLLLIIAGVYLLGAFVG
jgi:hypothetical protein